MVPQAVPRLVFGLGLLWAWINMPIPIYGTLWLMGIAYFTVFLPLGLRTIAGVVLQIDQSLEECARVCGASWVHQMRTVSLPLLRPGLTAAWLLIFIAGVRELGVSIFLMGPQLQSDCPHHHQFLAQRQLRTLGRHGAAADRHGVHRRRHAVPGRAPRAPG